MEEEMQFDWAGLMKLLAENLYNKKQVFIRELVQNAHDAIQRRTQPESGRIEVEIDPLRRRLCIIDNGIGMDDTDLRKYLSTVGIGATRLSGKPGLVGHFGIGFLSAFIVAERVEVVTRKEGAVDSYRWKNTGSRQYSITKCQELTSSGTRVEVYVRPEEVGIVSREEVVAVVAEYCDMLRIPITIKGESQPLNRMVMPWEVTYSNPRELEIQTRLYLYDKLGGDALEIIPIRRMDLDGVLYISKTRVVGVNSPQTVRVHVQRMMVAENLPSLLPSWATAFISGFINSSKLMPTAARDNVKTGEEFEEVREILGDIIVEHFEEIRRSMPERFSEIQKFHWLGLRSACANYPEFFEKFADLLEWRTNNLEPSNKGKVVNGVSLRTLPEIIRIAEAQDPGAQFTAIRCFDSANAASHVFEMAMVAKVVVIDASPAFDLQLLRTYVNCRGDGRLQLVRVDQDDDPLFFRVVTQDEEPAINKLANAMSAVEYVGPGKQVIRPRILARRFEPASLPAIIRQDQTASDKLERARAILEDLAQPQDVRDLAEGYIKEAESAMCLALNANNPFVRALAQQDLFDPMVRRLMTGLYNSAFLSSDAMSPHNATVLHGDMLYFLASSLDNFISRKATTDEPVKASAATAGAKRHAVFFMITPFADKYRSTIDSVRAAVEDIWGAELLIASDLKLDDRILDSIRQHVDMADGFIVEVSEANPNVMFELGYIFDRKHTRPIITLASSVVQNTGEKRVALPSDIQSMIFIDYKDADGDSLGNLFDAEAKKDPRVSAILHRSGRVRFVSARKVQDIMGVLTPSICKALAKEFSTADDWKGATSESLGRLLPIEFRAMSEILLKRMVDGLTLH